jgi:glycosyltransferase involved in cell wall biosynthesis
MDEQGRRAVEERLKLLQATARERSRHRKSLRKAQLEERGVRCLDAPPFRPNPQTPLLVLLTTFADIQLSYSLASVVVDQARAGLHAGMAVELWTLPHFNDLTVPRDLAHHPDFRVRKVVPCFTWESDTVKNEDLLKVEAGLFPHLDALRNAVVVCHDLIFQEWFCTYAKALHDYGGCGNGRIRWYHMCHSRVEAHPITEGPARWRSRLPRHHRLLALSYEEVPRMARFYQTDAEEIRVMTNVRDITHLLGMDDFTRRIIYDHGLLTADVVQVYPFSATRTVAKGVGHLFRLFSELVLLGPEARLVLVDAHATDERAREQRAALDGFADDLGIADKVMWTSDRLEEDRRYAGLAHLQVMHLFQVSNLFAFPSVSEASPLVLLEAAAAGCLLVGNSRVPTMADLFTTGSTLYFPFSDDADFDVMAQQVVEALGNPQNVCKRQALRKHSVPAMADSLQRLVAEG